MKYYKMLVAVLLIPCVLYFLCSPISWTVSAADAESQENLVALYEEVLEISVFYEQKLDSVIKCFDVNENGWYAIGYERDVIQIYDNMGTFQYGCRFDAIGTYAMLLKKQYSNLCGERSCCY